MTAAVAIDSPIIHEASIITSTDLWVTIIWYLSGKQMATNLSKDKIVRIIDCTVKITQLKNIWDMHNPYGMNWFPNNYASSCWGITAVLSQMYVSDKLKTAIQYLQCPPLILAPLVNMRKGSCENKSALFILFIFYSKNSQNSNLSLK